MRHLPNERIAQIYERLCKWPLHRAALFGGLPSDYVHLLSLAPSPSEQILLDLHAMNEETRLETGQLPLEVYLTNAERLSGPTQRGAFYRSCREEMMRASEVVCQTPPHYLDWNEHKLCLELAEAHRQRSKRVSARCDATEADRWIASLREKMRVGGRLRSGDMLSDERFLLQFPLGDGACGQVWAGVENRGCLKPAVAIKVLHPHLVKAPGAFERFCQGVAVMDDLRHESVVRVLHPVSEDHGFYYFVMELVGGSCLDTAILGGRVDVQDVVPVILGVGSALALAHKSDYIHRDVTPFNVLVEWDDTGNVLRPVLTDFDLVIRRGASIGTSWGLGTRLGIGTFPFAAPELMGEPEEASFSADVYALAMIMVFAIHGARLPKRIMSDAPHFASSLRIPKPFSEVLARALQWEPERRYQNAAEFCDALQQAEVNIGRCLSTNPRPSSTPPIEPAQEDSPAKPLTRLIVAAPPNIGALLAEELRFLQFELRDLLSAAAQDREERNALERILRLARFLAEQSVPSAPENILHVLGRHEKWATELLQRARRLGIHNRAIWRAVVDVGAWIERAQESSRACVDARGKAS